MNAATVDFDTMPASLRRDGGRAIATVKRAPPVSPFAPKRRRLDARTIAKVLKFSEQLGQIDANESAMFLRSLLYIMPQPYEFKYPDIRYADIWPVNYSVPTGATTHGYHEYDELGTAQIADNYGDNAPNAERVGYEVTGNIYSLRSEYSYSIQDLRSQAFSGIPLDAMKAITARRIIERKCDALAATGDAVRGFTGMANATGITAVTASTKTAGGLRWGTLSGSTVTQNATANEILNDVNTLLDGVFVTTKGTHKPDTLVLGTQNFAIVSTLRLDNFNMTTIGAYLLSSLPWLKSIEYWPQLDTAGAGSLERILCAQRSPENFQLIIPQEFEQFAPQQQNLVFKVPCHKRFGVPQVRFPKSISFMDGTV